MSVEESIKKQERIEAIDVDIKMVTSLAPVRPPDGHKGTFGTLLIRAGSEEMGGAAYMCCEAALRSGVGLVRMFVDQVLIGSMLPLCPQAVYTSASGSPEERIRQWRKLLDAAGATVFGPGLDLHAEGIVSELLFLIENAPKLILDAGAMTVLSENREILFPALSERVTKNFPPAILTPHPGEFSRLVSDWDSRDRHHVPQKFAVQNSVILVLKGHHTAVFTPEGIWYISTSGNDGLAKGGSGDVLAGLIGGFLAQGMVSSQAAISGVFIHGLCGELASERLGKRYMQPTDLFGFLPETFRRCGWDTINIRGEK
jgi:NAD(P)H-hydrate epimerase